ncbi:MAG: cation:proton antiporter, partial [Neisseria elongata]
MLLGLLASPSELPAAVVPALVIGSALTFIARPISVLACLTPFREKLRTQLFISWAGMRGALPIMLATIPLTHNLPGASHMF